MNASDDEKSRSPSDDPVAISDHLRPPVGVSREMHALNLCLCAIALRIHASGRWLDQDEPDIAAARRTATKLVELVCELERLVAAINVSGVPD